MTYNSKTPVLIIIFNRPIFVKNLINILRQVKPSKIYVVADGPRNFILEDKDNCIKAREEINKIDWVCDIKRKYSDKNLGCGINPSEGISWALKDSEEVIILEDDCMPNIEFFRFCDNLLEKYKLNDQVMMVSGNNHTFNKYDFSHSYDFSHHTQTSGWATWRRAWSKYDISMSSWPEFRSFDWLESFTGSKKAAKFWLKIFDMCYNNELNSAWDYQWTYCCWVNNGINIIPKVNLVSNIGFSSQATHEKDPNHLISQVPTSTIEFPLIHPEEIIKKTFLDKTIQKIIYTPPIYTRIINKLSTIIK